MSTLDQEHSLRVLRDTRALIYLTDVEDAPQLTTRDYTILDNFVASAVFLRSWRTRINPYVLKNGQEPQRRLWYEQAEASALTQEGTPTADEQEGADAAMTGVGQPAQQAPSQTGAPAESDHQAHAQRTPHSGNNNNIPPPSMEPASGDDGGGQRRPYQQAHAHGADSSNLGNGRGGTAHTVRDPPITISLSQLSTIVSQTLSQTLSTMREASPAVSQNTYTRGLHKNDIGVISSAERQLIRTATIRQIYDVLIKQYKPPISEVNKRLKESYYALDDARRDHNINAFMLHTVYDALDPLIRTLVTRPGPHSSPQAFLKEVYEQWGTIRDLAIKRTIVPKAPTAVEDISVATEVNAAAGPTTDIVARDINRTGDGRSPPYGRPQDTRQPDRPRYGNNYGANPNPS
ncbi:hypothetical protein MY11210_003467 [Beauveria gryllotalpidicola]